MSRHPIRLIVPAFLCAIAVGFLVALLLRAIQTNAASFVPISLIGVVFFACRCYAEVRRAWPSFTRHLARRREMRMSPPVIRINLPKEDIQ